MPKRIVIVGGGAVGTEWATMFSAFGSEVTLVELLPNLLPLEDEDMGRTLARSFQKRGIKVLTELDGGQNRSRQASATLKVTITDKDGKNEQTVEADNVLIGVSRRPNTLDLNLEKTGVETDKRGYISVDDQMRTNVNERVRHWRCGRQDPAGPRGDAPGPGHRRRSSPATTRGWTTRPCPPRRLPTPRSPASA